jgi:hypothetical protein
MSGGRLEWSLVSGGCPLKKGTKGTLQRKESAQGPEEVSELRDLNCLAWAPSSSLFLEGPPPSGDGEGGGCHWVHCGDLRAAFSCAHQSLRPIGRPSGGFSVTVLERVFLFGSGD